jgi:hypothetical protein
MIAREPTTNSTLTDMIASTIASRQPPHAQLHRYQPNLRYKGRR